jgi:hypothetical protein
MKIAILFDENEKLHSTSWSIAWEEYCQVNNISYQVVNPYLNNVIKKLLEFDIILWHYSNYSFKDMLMARNVLLTLEDRGKKVFPSKRIYWKVLMRLSRNHTTITTWIP